MLCARPTSYLFSRTGYKRPYFDLTVCLQRGLFQSRNLGFLAARRHSKIRKLLFPFSSFEKEDVMLDSVERIGNDYLLNWELNYLNVTPAKDAFRNLHLQGLLNCAEGRTWNSKNGSITVDLSGESQPETYLITENPDNSSCKTLSSHEYDELFKEVTRRHLSERVLYVHDGAIGSHRWAEVPIRVITDSANTALLLRHIIPPVPLRSPREQPVSFVVYLATSFKHSHPERFGLQGNSFSVLNYEKGQLLLGGHRSSSFLKNSLMGIAARDLQTKKVFGLL